MSMKEGHDHVALHLFWGRARHCHQEIRTPPGSKQESLVETRHALSDALARQDEKLFPFTVSVTRPGPE
jgi:hypothetical protein